MRVLSEPAQNKSEFGEIGLIPARSSLARRPIRDRVAYVLQNLAYLRLPDVVRRTAPDVVVVHSSFLNLPGLFPTILNRLDRVGRPKLVLDVRDRLLPRRRAAAASRFDAVIACSGNVVAHLRDIGLPHRRVHHVPVVQEPLAVGKEQIEELVGRLGLSRPYVLFAGLVKESKGIKRLLEAYAALRSEGFDRDLVVAGLLKTRSASVRRMLDDPGVHYLGNLARTDVLTLMAGSDVCVNPSEQEGLPRSSLEPLGLGVKALLPSCVPEFVEQCPDWVVAPDVDLAERIAWSVASPGGPSYPIHDHLPSAVLPRYIDVLMANA